MKEDESEREVAYPKAGHFPPSKNGFRGRKWDQR